MTSEQELGFIREIEASIEARKRPRKLHTPAVADPRNGKPCPFCGQDDLRIQDGASGLWAAIACGRCGATGPDVKKHPLDFGHDMSAEDKTIIDAMASWNDRVLT